MVDIEAEKAASPNIDFRPNNAINRSSLYEEEFYQFPNLGSPSVSPGNPTGPRKRNLIGSFAPMDEARDDNLMTGHNSDGEKGQGSENGMDSSGDEHQNLLKQKRRAQDQKPACYALRRYLGWIVSREKRFLHIKGKRTPSKFPTNRLNNQKYNVLTLVPLVLFNQFKFFYNFFFLAIGLSQFIPPLKVGFLITYIAPLAFVLAITIIKEFFDDVQRMRKDMELNSKQYL
jgi:hypothetical protein